MIGMLLLGLFARDFDKLYFLTNNLYSFLAILVQLIFISKFVGISQIRIRRLQRLLDMLILDVPRIRKL